MVIYKTINLINNKIYVGKDEFNNPDYLGSGLLLNKAINKYGRANFKKEILEECKTREKLNEREIFWIEKLNSTNRKIGYNIALGGTGGDTFSCQTDLKKEKIISKRREKTINSFKGEKYRESRREITNRLWADPAHRKHMSEIMTGRKVSWGDKISKSNKEFYKNNPISEERRKIMSESHLGKGIGENNNNYVEVDSELKDKILEMYESIGPNLISKELTKLGFNVSRHVVVRVLKELGVYKKYQKGVGETRFKKASISRVGDKNPNFKNV